MKLRDNKVSKTLIDILCDRYVENNLLKCVSPPESSPQKLHEPNDAVYTKPIFEKIVKSEAKI